MGPHQPNGQVYQLTASPGVDLRRRPQLLQLDRVVLTARPHARHEDLLAALAGRRLGPIVTLGGLRRRAALLLARARGAARAAVRVPARRAAPVGRAAAGGDARVRRVERRAARAVRAGGCWEGRGGGCDGGAPRGYAYACCHHRGDPDQGHSV